ncbi:nodulation protein L [Helicobacter sp. NHP19-003]|uniref:Nodulation protein L n=1 Tax=Helicobacter gastrocanis TaxID=2849641 RepID=A0ABM7SCP1_9HELI|nr:DapH/DapD/GlmU-related protein [Helicobacter sp. NHP19-003]BCZ17766.1 nodulation protein L [Helicobacter sp. NHP19-003]
MKDIFERDLSGEMVSMDEPEFDNLYGVIQNAQKLIHKLNTQELSPEEIRALMAELTGKPFDATNTILPPFYVDFGRNINFGKHFFMNTACTFMDRGGIEIGDHVFIGPRVCLTTTNHDFNPYNRRTTFSKPIVIKDRVWICINATICPGVTIGQNSIIAAGAVVTKNVPLMSLWGAIRPKSLSI